ncbi:hypothetical protein LINPERPRIM_LOCUS29678 [Linum perenne]
MSSYHWSCPPPFHHYPTIPLQVFQRRKVRYPTSLMSNLLPMITRQVWKFIF